MFSCKFENGICDVPRFGDIAFGYMISFKDLPHEVEQKCKQSGYCQLIDFIEYEVSGEVCVKVSGLHLDLLGFNQNLPFIKIPFPTQSLLSLQYQKLSIVFKPKSIMTATGEFKVEDNNITFHSQQMLLLNDARRRIAKLDEYATSFKQFLQKEYTKPKGEICSVIDDLLGCDISCIGVTENSFFCLQKSQVLKSQHGRVEIKWDKQQHDDEIRVIICTTFQNTMHYKGGLQNLRYRIY